MIDDDAPLTAQLCARVDCNRGPDGVRAMFVPAKAWSKFCCRSCRMIAAGRRRRAGDPPERLEPDVHAEGLPASALTTDNP